MFWIEELFGYDPYIKAIDANSVDNFYREEIPFANYSVILQGTTDIIYYEISGPKAVIKLVQAQIMNFLLMNI